MTAWCDLLADHPVVPVLVLENAEVAPAVAEALAAGGIGIVEVTLRTKAAEAALRNIAAGTDVLVGAGTVISIEDVDRAVRAGARFVVAPGLDGAVVRRCQDLDVAVLPGVATATEIMAALALGLDTVKLFPAELLGGVAAVRALAGPFPQLQFVPSGGVTIDNLAAYLGHRAVLGVGGSWIATPGLIADGDLAAVTRLASEATAIAKQVQR